MYTAGWTTDSSMLYIPKYKNEHIDVPPVRSISAGGPSGRLTGLVPSGGVVAGGVAAGGMVDGGLVDGGLVDSN